MEDFILIDFQLKKPRKRHPCKIFAHSNVNILIHDVSAHRNLLHVVFREPQLTKVRVFDKGLNELDNFVLL